MVFMLAGAFCPRCCHHLLRWTDHMCCPTDEQQWAAHVMAHRFRLRRFRCPLEQAPEMMHCSSANWRWPDAALRAMNSRSPARVLLMLALFILGELVWPLQRGWASRVKGRV